MKPTTFDARWLQRVLADLGHYTGVIDGDIGPNTNAAIVAFKRANGLRPRPYVGPLTLKMLEDVSSDAMPIKFGPDTAPEPPWLVEIAKVMGLHEVHDNAELSAWLRSDGSTLGDPAQYPWCGDAAITALELALPDEPLPPDLERNPYWARSFAKYGEPCGFVRGAVLSFSRGKGGHVGFGMAWDQSRNRFLVRGGNQSNAVTDTWIAGSRLLAKRWPLTWSRNYQRAMPQIDSATANISTNEA
ncbi:MULTISPECIES: peptidoglycan-binding protein [Roseobacteraceae]|uniref:NlpC/P60 family protein n=1 Tax=Roseobacteraceae TaxID=2854170 RepID=UPI003B8AF212